MKFNPAHCQHVEYMYEAYIIENDYLVKIFHKQVKIDYKKLKAV